jgi:hypothetical protein
MTDAELYLASRDSLEMEKARTWAELEIACRNIEARHVVEGINDIDRQAYELVRERHKQRVSRAMVA